MSFEGAGYKRPRVESGYGMQGHHMGGPGPYGPGMGGPMDPSMMGPPQHFMGPGQYDMGGMGPMGMFPCVKLRGLPFDVSDDDIRMFLGCEPIDVVLVKRDGRLTGEAYVVLSNGMHVEMALSKNRSYMGRRYIEIYRAKKTDYYKAICSDVMEGGPAAGGGRWREERFQEREPRGPPQGGAGGEGFQGQGPDGTFVQGLPSGAAFDAATGAAAGTGGTTILKLRGLPFSISDDDICQWFNEDSSLGLSPVIKDNVLIVMDHGRPSGIAFVEFPSPQEATNAMGKNKQMMGTRYIEIFPANRADLDRYKARGGF
uniref:RRM domain-containing protein n=1 Tax=Chlamydomonas leiostraca TaxID=1034604 RepID=A0A7S0S406_9CHLO|mmetsp:Transcript_7823/g.19474  ORF Transcript_7823/g.19474 Transcript_7823/m.19474 type:complete len:314 (+) Transcript_7823:98-1039(+)|eukprot:CAMPEP_0202866976 /NCGR_PEP_ID=MMETSP1391-20130828/8459_1 /ASSEMBLY_ACC=CAM_ASM_000867 /TAXON_ID=1034604 /ORGANISM="Chlamydomonas leiostraca, Strain SAG 11-49" /LENGTH=313 /DNA_ID=CAMNT_0049546969 /DNA_START=93 /DNA_END=1034 /DNA_ORIENTATION=-